MLHDDGDNVASDVWSWASQVQSVGTMGNGPPTSVHREQSRDRQWSVQLVDLGDL